MDLGIKGKRALVCASSKGLGLGCAEALAEAGVDLVMNARTDGPLQEAAEAIRARYNVDVVAVAADITTEDGRAKVLEAAGQVDILVTAVPAGAATHHIIDAKILIAMKRSGHLINIARGDVVDETALIAALEDGEIAGAGLDVYEFEPRVPAALIALQNVVLLPHLGTAALEVRTAMGLMAADNLLAFDAGLPLPNAV